MEVNKGRFLNDRHGALVIYPDGVRDAHAVAEHEAQKVLQTKEHVRIEELFPHVLPSGQEIIVAVYPYRKRQGE